MSGHDWSHVDSGWGRFDEHGESANQYRVPRSLFENGTPTIVQGLTREVLGHDLGAVSTYGTPTFEDSQQYYGPGEYTPAGKQRAEDAGRPEPSNQYDPIDRAAGARLPRAQRGN